MHVYFELPVLSIDEGAMPTLAFGVGAGVGAHVRRLSLSLSARAWLPEDDRIQARGAYGAYYTRFTGSLSGCYAWPVGAFEIAPCLVVNLEVMTAHGSGPTVSGATGFGEWWTVGAGIRARWSLASWSALFLRPSVAFATSRPAYSIGDVGPVYRVSLATFGVNLGSDWTW